MMFKRLLSSKYEEGSDESLPPVRPRLAKTFSTTFFSSRLFLRQASIQQNTLDSLSPVGKSVYHSLKLRYFWHARKLWNVTTGKVIELDQMPRLQSLNCPAATELSSIWDGGDKDVRMMVQDPIDFKEGHTDWLPEKVCDIISRTRSWCDIVTLAPPDGLFLEKIKEAIQKIAVNSHSNGEMSNGSKKTTRLETTETYRAPIVLRIIFANIIGTPVNCDAMIKKLTKDIPKNSNIQLWIGAWRRKASWNHAKIIAVDGQYLHTGGMNLWEDHYLKSNPIHDLAIEMEGEVAVDGHLFSDEQWAYIEKQKNAFSLGKFVEKMPGGLLLPTMNRIVSSKYPKRVPDFPPSFASKKGSIAKEQRRTESRDNENHIPVITIGRNPALCYGVSGTFLRKARPSDAAIVAMIGSAKKSVRMILQDFGPMTIPGMKKVTIPGGKWPKLYLNALAYVLWREDVDVEIILSNPGSTPGGLKSRGVYYGYGWSVNDVASELIKRIKKQFFFIRDVDLRRKIKEKLRICYVGHNKSRTYSDGGNIGLHSKFFMVDDLSCYIGSQNLYICDLAEWGVIIDDLPQTEKIINEYWRPMWEGSYSADHCNLDKVMKGLKIS